VAWDETKTDMTVNGADLELDEGAIEGSYNTGARDCGFIGIHYIECECEVTQSPAATGTFSWKIEIDTSDDDVAYNGFVLFQEGEYSCRYYKIKVTVFGEPASAQRPKINRLEDCVRALGMEACPAPITEVKNQPAGGETRGVRHRVGTGAGTYAGLDDYIIETEDGTTPSFRRYKPREGTRVWNDDTNRADLYDENGNWVIWDPRRLGDGHVTIWGWCISATGAGTWTPTVNAGQLMTNGFLDNWSGALQADLDEVDYQLTLSIGTYTIDLLTREGPGQAIIDIDLDSPSGGAVEVASFDCYAAGGALNIKKQDAGNVITEAGLYTMTVRVDGRNGAANDWKADIGGIALWRTA
jgi:hypothetical protein